jgi:tetratricopeptide (TPR) repeat protein
MTKKYIHKAIILSALLILNNAQINAQSSFSQETASKVTVRDLLEAHEKAPRSDTYYLLALADTRKGNYEQAEKAIRTGLQINPRNWKLMNLQGAIYSRKGKLTKARRMFLNVLRLNPDDKYAQTSLRTIEKQLQPKKQKLIISQPSKLPTVAQSPEAPVSISQPKPQKEKILESSYFLSIKDKQNCFYNMSKLQRAQDTLSKSDPTAKSKFDSQKLIEKNIIPAIPVCPNGGAYGLDGSEISCSKHGKLSAVGAEVKTVFIDFNKGMRSKLSRNYLDALKAFEQVVILYPRWAEAHYQMGDTLFRLGESDPAIIEIRQCLKHDKNHLDAQLLLANLYFKKGQKQAALTILDKITKSKKGTVYGLAARSIAKSIRSGRNYYQIFPPN